MAIIVEHTKDLPEYNGRLIPGLKPPMEFLFSEAGNPEEVDAFLELLREIKGKPPKATK